MLTDEKEKDMVPKCIVHMHITAELKAYWFYFYFINGSFLDLVATLPCGFAKFTLFLF